MLLTEEVKGVDELISVDITHYIGWLLKLLDSAYQVLTHLGILRTLVSCTLAAIWADIAPLLRKAPFPTYFAESVIAAVESYWKTLSHVKASHTL